jgi:protein-S-isoprenylcysteine O-methyltransferase Ste14
MAEARKLVTGGPYRIVRHPLYLGEQVSIAGVLLQYLSPAVLFVFAVQIAFQFYRMSCEEKILAATFPEYAEYAKRTWRILPGLY